jgi:PPE-repeat protein
MGLALGWLTEGATSLAAAGQTYQTAFDGMIPGPVCDTNRATQAGLVASNVLGQNTPAIVALDTEYFGHMWTTNAAAMSMWQAAATATITSLAVPPPFNPVIANPAGPAAAVAGAAAQTSMSGATQPMEAAGSSSMMSEITPLLSQFGQMGSMAGQLPQMLGQLPQMASQFPQMLTGMLGGQLNPSASSTAAVTPFAAAGGAGSLGAEVGATASTGVGGGGVGGVGGLPLASSYTRPANAFTTPTTPKVPTGWDAAPTPTPGTAAPMGGMYGAAPASALGNQTEGDKPAGRTVKVAPRNGR